jgi:hypothetical protein
MGQGVLSQQVIDSRAEKTRIKECIGGAISIDVMKSGCFRENAGDGLSARGTREYKLGAC